MYKVQSQTSRQLYISVYICLASRNAISRVSLLYLPQGNEMGNTFLGFLNPLQTPSLYGLESTRKY